MKKAIIACCLISILAITSHAQEITWETKLERVTAKAAEQDKLVLLHFTADWCRPCQQLETFVFSNSMVQTAIAEQTVAMKVDVDLLPDLAKEFGVTAVPFDVAMTPDGRLLLNRRSPLDAFGYAKMISSLSKLATTSNDSETASIRRDLIDLQRSMAPANNALVDRGFSPDGPSHSMPAYSAESRDLMRKSAHYDQVKVVKNPFFDPNKPKADVQVANDSSNESTPGLSFEVNDDSNSAAANGVVAKKESKRVLNPMFNKTPSQPAPELVADNSFALPIKNQTPMETPEKPTVNELAFETELEVPKIVSPSEVVMPLVVENDSNDFNPAKSEMALNPINQDNVVEPQVPTQNEVADRPLQAIPSAEMEFALQGKCPVTLAMETKWSDGNPIFGCTHRGRTYLFASEAKLEIFQQAPDKFSPLLAGYDPVEFHESGELSNGMEEFGVFMGQQGEQKIVLFQNESNRDKFKSNPRLFMESVRVAMNQADLSSIR